MQAHPCPVCLTNEWRDLDDLRDANYWRMHNEIGLDEPVGFIGCEHCGFLTYRQRRTEDQIRAYYRTEYRSAVQAMNLVTCGRKNEYHKAFLDILADGTIEGLPGGPNAYELNWLDVGCAQGSFLKMLRDDCHVRNDHLAGTEWTIGFREYGVQEYGLNIAEDPPEGRKFDVISLYHVLEHLLDPRASLLKYRDMLTERGMLYISHPIWLRYLQEASGTTANDWENLLHLNHINVFTVQSAQNLLASCGFKIIKENLSYYGYTWLAVPSETREIVPENLGDHYARLSSQRRAVNLLAQGKPAEALAIEPLFPDAYCQAAFYKENLRDENAQKGILDRAMALMPDCAQIVRQRALAELQWSQAKAKKGETKYTNEVKRAEQLLLKSGEIKPMVEDGLHIYAMIRYVYAKDPEGAIRAWRKAAQINPMRWNEFETYIGHVRANLPLPQVEEPDYGEAPQAPSRDVTMVVTPKLQRVADYLGVKAS